MPQAIALRQAAVAPSITMAHAFGISETIAVRALRVLTTAMRLATALNRERLACRGKEVGVFANRLTTPARLQVATTTATHLAIALKRARRVLSIAMAPVYANA